MSRYWERRTALEVLFSDNPLVSDPQMRKLLELAQVGFDFHKSEMDRTERIETGEMLLEIERMTR